MLTAGAKAGSRLIAPQLNVRSFANRNTTSRVSGMPSLYNCRASRANRFAPEECSWNSRSAATAGVQKHDGRPEAMGPRPPVTCGSYKWWRVRDSRPRPLWFSALTGTLVGRIVTSEPCPAEKRKAIEEALRHSGLIWRVRERRICRGGHRQRGGAPVGRRYPPRFTRCASRHPVSTGRWRKSAPACLSNTTLGRYEIQCRARGRPSGLFGTSPC